VLVYIYCYASATLDLAGMIHIVRGQMHVYAGKTVKSLYNACHTWTRLTSEMRLSSAYFSMHRRIAACCVHVDRPIVAHSSPGHSSPIRKSARPRTFLPRTLVPRQSANIAVGKYLLLRWKRCREIHHFTEQISASDIKSCEVPTSSTRWVETIGLFSFWS